MKAALATDSADAAQVLLLLPRTRPMLAVRSRLSIVLCEMASCKRPDSRSTRMEATRRSKTTRFACHRFTAGRRSEVAYDLVTNLFVHCRSVTDATAPCSSSGASCTQQAVSADLIHCSAAIFAKRRSKRWCLW